MEGFARLDKKEKKNYSLESDLDQFRFVNRVKSNLQFVNITRKILRGLISISQKATKIFPELLYSSKVRAYPK